MCRKAVAHSFVLVTSLTQRLTCLANALLVSVKDWRGVLAFRPDFFVGVSLRMYQLSARTDYIWDTDTVTRECFDS